MRKALRLIAVLAALGLTAWIGVVALAQGSSAPTPSTSTTTSPAPTGAEDVKGNCDEAEHVNDPECVGVNLVPEDDDQGDVSDDDQDENDDDQGDNSGPGSENSGSGSEDSGSGS
jgi:hypothetical protein